MADRAALAGILIGAVALAAAVSALVTILLTSGEESDAAPTMRPIATAAPFAPVAPTRAPIPIPNVDINDIIERNELERSLAEQDRCLEALADVADPFSIWYQDSFHATSACP